MHPELWQRVQDIFHQALERPAGGRDAWLDEACAGDADLRAEVASLLESDRAADEGFVRASIEHAVVDLYEGEPPPRPPIAPGRRIGPYRLISMLGQGGMGAVFLAVRADEQYESQVAIKFVRPGLDTDFILRRFRRERQILARLHHPNIARLFDGGTTEDGVPYLVMEHIDGSRITNYAAQNHLDIEGRIRLFLPVCSAVEYAHRLFIVHRDLKPGNILIDASGTPKLLDFGISKLLHSEPRDGTETQGAGMMTPDYASPEQIAGDPVTIASDVYSLGAVLYELLTGLRPHRIEKSTPAAWERAICDTPILLPSLALRAYPSLARRFAGDLDNILLRAMQKEPERRYVSAEQLAEDLRCYLQNRPVQARPDSLQYRAGKFLRRNRFAVALAGAAAAAVVGVASFAAYDARASQQRLRQVTGLAATLLLDVEQATRGLPGSPATRRMVARTGLQYLDNLSRNAGADRVTKRQLAAAYGHMGDALGNPASDNPGDTAGAGQAYSKMVEITKALWEASPTDPDAVRDFAAAQLGLGTVLPPERMAEKRAALERAHEFLSRAIQQHANDPQMGIAKACDEVQLADLLLPAGDRAAAAGYYRMAIQTAETVLAGNPADSSAQRWLIEAARKLAEEQARSGDRSAALSTLDTALRLARDVDRSAPADSVALRGGVARAWQAAGSVYALLAGGEQGGQRLQDRDTARMWYQRALSEWQHLEHEGGFLSPLRKEIDAASAALGALAEGSTVP